MHNLPTHPTWCLGAPDCTVTGELGVGAHVGKTVQIPTGDLLISLSLYQGARLYAYADGEITMVLVYVKDTVNPDQSTGFPLRLQPAREIAAVLRSMVSAATR